MSINHRYRRAAREVAETYFMVGRPVSLKYVGTLTSLASEIGNELEMMPGDVYLLDYRGEVPWKSGNALDFMICRDDAGLEGASCLYSSWEKFWDNWDFV